jgi:hypothetical protein
MEQRCTAVGFSLLHGRRSWVQKPEQNTGTNNVARSLNLESFLCAPSTRVDVARSAKGNNLLEIDGLGLLSAGSGCLVVSPKSKQRCVRSSNVYQQCLTTSRDVHHGMITLVTVSVTTLTG